MEGQEDSQPLAG